MPLMHADFPDFIFFICEEARRYRWKSRSCHSSLQNETEEAIFGAGECEQMNSGEQLTMQ